MAALDSQIENLILNKKRWSDLDSRTQDLIGSSLEYDKKVVQYSIKHQLRYRGNLVRLIKHNEREYYQDLLFYSRQNLMLFPYHLSDFIITGMRMTPFQYYLQMLIQIIELEKSYDSLPNFTAADCLRLLGIGRNQYIDIMNQLRTTRRTFLGLGRKNVRELLPCKPVDTIPIEPWWLVNAGYITEEDVQLMVNQSERLIIDRLVTPDGMTNQIHACEADEKLIRSLYLKGLIYLDVPIYDDDFIVVPPLEGFVMNRTTGDYFETLLYKIFVSIDQNTSVAELASILQIDIQLVKNAVSMYCRLGFAYKRTVRICFGKCHPSWEKRISEYLELGISQASSTPMLKTLQCSKSKEDDKVTNARVDNNVVQQQDHVVKKRSVLDLNHSSDDSGSIIDETLIEFDENEQKVIKTISHSPSNLLGITQQQQQRRIVFFYDSTLAAFLMMGNLSSKLKIHAVTMFEVGKLPDESIDSLLIELAKINSDSIEEDGIEAIRYYTHAMMLYRTVEFFRTNPKVAADLLESENFELLKTDAKRISLDLVRVESLANLDMESCQRLLRKNYQLMISIAPLSHEAVSLNALIGLPHFGPGSPLINSLWFRLFLYHSTGFGPPSLLLTKGYRLPYLPSIFLGFDNILITPWNRDPVCVPTLSALFTINETLTNFPCLIQAYPRQPPRSDVMMSDKDKAFVVLPLDSSTTLQLRNSQRISLDCSIGPIEQIDSAQEILAKLDRIFDLSHVCGYVTLLRCSSGCNREEKSTPCNKTIDQAIQELTIKTDQSDVRELDNSRISAEIKINEANENISDEQKCETIAYDNNLKNSAHNLGNKSYNIIKNFIDDNEDKKKISPDNLCKSDAASYMKQETIQQEQLSNLCDDGLVYTLFDCQFGVPLFDQYLNEQILDRISRFNLCTSESLAKIVATTELMARNVNQFTQDFCRQLSSSNPELTIESSGGSGGGDQRHFYSFDPASKHKSIVPFPSVNLVYISGKLSLFDPSSS